METQNSVNPDFITGGEAIAAALSQSACKLKYLVSTSSMHHRANVANFSFMAYHMALVAEPFVELYQDCISFYIGASFEGECILDRVELGVQLFWCHRR